MVGFPGGSVVKNPPSKAGHTYLIPDLGRSHKPQSAKPTYHNYCACTLEPGNHNYRSPCALEQQRPPQKEVRTPQLESCPHLLQLEKANMHQ